jgi:hypothetical protein
MTDPFTKTIRVEATPPKIVIPIDGRARRVRVLDTSGKPVPATVSPFIGSAGFGETPPQRIVTLEGIEGVVEVQYLIPSMADGPKGRGTAGKDNGRGRGPNFAKDYRPKVTTMPGRQGGEWRGKAA